MSALSSEFDQLAELYTIGLNLYFDWAKQKGFSINEFHVLYYLGTAGEATQKNIADEWLIPKQTVSAVCKHLTEQGYLQHRAGESDKREKTLSLTQKGKNIALPMITELNAIEARTANEFGLEKCADLIKQIRTLLNLFEKNLQEHGTQI